MTKHETCCACRVLLKKDEIALTRKMVGRKTIEFYCVSCLADYLDCTSIDLEVKIQEFREQGCGLFL